MPDQSDAVERSGGHDTSGPDHDGTPAGNPPEASATRSTVDAPEPAEWAASASGTDDESEVSFGWRGWVLVATVVLSFLVIPWVMILLPSVQGVLRSIGLGLRDAYLVLPFVPAVGLAIVAVWSALAHRRRGSQ